MKKFMVSYRQRKDGMSGNQTFDNEKDARCFILVNEVNWTSHSLFWYEDVGFLNVLNPM